MAHLAHAPLGELPVADERGLFVGNHHYPLGRELELLTRVLGGL